MITFSFSLYAVLISWSSWISANEEVTSFLIRQLPDASEKWKIEKKNSEDNRIQEKKTLKKKGGERDVRTNYDDYHFVVFHSAKTISIIWLL